VFEHFISVTIRTSISVEIILSPRPSIPRGVWVLGFVSLLMDISSELIHSLLPVFMVSVLGASVLMVGIVEGIAEATALIVKMFSGALSDYFGKRKALAVLGYGLGAISKPLFALAMSVPAVLAARFMDRIGKGIRGAPRDALVADITPPEIRGAAFGLRQTLDALGAVAGPLLGIVLMIVFAGDFRAVFWFAVIPAFLCVALLIAGVREPAAATSGGKVGVPVRWRTLCQLRRDYWLVVIFGGVFTLARFSEAFLILRARDFGLPDTYAPAVLIVMNLVFALTAYPIGLLADRMSRRTLLIIGLVLLIAADVVLAYAPGLGVVALGVVLWGLHMGLTQGLLATMVADTAPPELRGTAFGLFNFVSGIAMLIASVLAGFLWDEFGAATTFYAGAGISAVALMLLAGRKSEGAMSNG
jgi:MFS family permease